MGIEVRTYKKLLTYKNTSDYSAFTSCYDLRDKQTNINREIIVIKRLNLIPISANFSRKVSLNEICFFFCNNSRNKPLLYFYIKKRKFISEKRKSFTLTDSSIKKLIKF